MESTGTLARSAIRVAGFALALVALSALAVTLAGAGEWARALLAFGFDPPPPSLAGAAALALNNLRVALLGLGSAVLVLLAPRARLLCDALVGTAICLNALLVGIALGAYGGPLLAPLAMHGPLELAGLALAGGSYLEARVGRASAPVLLRAATASAALLALAALVETWGPA